MSRCGACTLCCELLEVAVLHKAANTQCLHCVRGTGCSIWENRPAVCRQYFCLWAVSNKLPENLRPDKCGVVFEPLRDRPIMLALTSPERPDAWRGAHTMHLIEMLLQSGTAVIATDGTDKNVLLPEGQTADEVWAHVKEGTKEMGLV